MQAMATETFISHMRGPVIRRMDADYDAVRSLYNGMIDKSPVMIARCTDAADVVTAVNSARQNDLLEILLHCLTGAREIAHRLMALVRHPTPR